MMGRGEGGGAKPKSKPLYVRGFNVTIDYYKYQGFKGIIQSSINWCTSPMIIHKIILCRLKLVFKTFEHITLKLWGLVL